MESSLAKKMLELETKSLGYSEWLTVTQDNIDKFADASLDHDPMHVDPVWVRANTEFEDTISFGFLTMSLLTYFAHDVFSKAFPEMPGEGAGWGLNYGFDKVRFIEPVPVNSRIRAAFTVESVKTIKEKRLISTLATTIEIEGNDRPALSAQWLWMWVFPEVEQTNEPQPIGG